MMTLETTSNYTSDQVTEYSVCCLVSNDTTILLEYNVLATESSIYCLTASMHGLEHIRRTGIIAGSIMKLDYVKGATCGSGKTPDLTPFGEFAWISPTALSRTYFINIYILIIYCGTVHSELCYITFKWKANVFSPGKLYFLLSSQTNCPIFKLYAYFVGGDVLFNNTCKYCCVERERAIDCGIYGFVLT